MTVGVTVTRSGNDINIDVIFRRKISRKEVDIATFAYSHPIADVRKMDWPASAFSGYLSTYKRQVQSKLKSIDRKVGSTVRKKITELKLLWNAQRAKYPRTKAGRAKLKSWYASKAVKLAEQLARDFETDLKEKVYSQVMDARLAAQKELLRANPKWEKDMLGVASQWFSATSSVSKLIALFPVAAPAEGLGAAADTAQEVAGAGAAANTSLGKIKKAYKAHSLALRKRPKRLADTFKTAFSEVNSALTQLEELAATIANITDEVSKLNHLASASWKSEHERRAKTLAARKDALERKMKPEVIEEIHGILKEANDKMIANATKFAALDFKGFDSMLKEIAQKT